LVLDTGALVALERRAVRVLTDLELARSLDLPIRIPAGVLAQVWRGGARSAAIARLLKQPCDVVMIDERSAREIGEFIASLPVRDGEPDVVDAHVALTTRATRSLVLTSDPADMTRYGVPEELVRRL
jgi:predicted nucleic acid-binding protein